MEEYQAAIFASLTAAKLLAQYDIPQLLRDIERAHAVGPILNPTLWMEKSKAMDEDRNTLKAALPLWELAQKLKAL